MIYTVTFNPSIDYYLHLDRMNLNQINRVPEYEFIAGGKGINVSRMLANLNIRSCCVFFAGGFTGQYLIDEVAKNPLITVEAIRVSEPSRVNVKIRHDGETDLNTKGAPLPEEGLEELLRICAEVEENDYVCICGSLQGKELISTVIEIGKRVNEKKARLILDVPNMSLEDIVACKPYMIKPNIEELQDLMSSTLQFPEILKEAKDKLILKGVTSILLSMGGDGGYYLSADKEYRIQGPKLKPLNTVAAGDSMLSATVGKLSEGLSVSEAIRWGSACGSAAVLVPYIPDENQVKEILSEVKVSEC